MYTNYRISIKRAHNSPEIIFPFPFPQKINLKPLVIYLHQLLQSVHKLYNFKKYIKLKNYGKIQNIVKIIIYSPGSVFQA